MDMFVHPNFPPSLSITPNEELHHADTASSSQDAFGVEAQRDAIQKYGIAGRVWEAACALSTYVKCDGPFEFDPPFIDHQFLHQPIVAIELGSGTGVVSARIAQSLSSSRLRTLISTDLPDVCPLLQQNLYRSSSSGTFDKSPGGVVHVRALSWGNFEHAMSIAEEFCLLQSYTLTHIICSDLASAGFSQYNVIVHSSPQVYFPELFGPLLRSLIHLTSPPCTSFDAAQLVKIVISYKIRSLPKETAFWTAFGLWFSFHPVLARHVGVVDESGPWKQLGAGDYADRTYVFVASRRPESLSWEMPLSDKDLIEGAGARGTPSKKSDDTFETILFMGMDDIDYS
ncbi:hypothetical protein F5I97DRAFT_2037479 [Phlebopus sp. FC_14]|nr:hypothetical protein F5I97DRAFT_2037479 [Phlebopus sp. FC_14]